MKEKLDTSIRLSHSVKESLDEMKEQYSANEYIRLMLRFFKKGDIDPSQKYQEKNMAVLKAIEQVKKMIRAIERDKIDLMLPENTKGSNELERAQEEIVRLKQEVSLLRKRSENVVADTESQKKLRAVELFIGKALDEKNFVRANGGRGDFFVQPLYLSGVINEVKNLCS